MVDFQEPPQIGFWVTAGPDKRLRTRFFRRPDQTGLDRNITDIWINYIFQKNYTLRGWYTQIQIPRAQGSTLEPALELEL